VAKKSGGIEAEQHVVAVRMRVTGSGELDMSLTDLQDVQTLNLVPFTMAATTRIEPTRIANFQSQRIRLVGSTNTINETFRISRIIIFAKAVAVEYPG
jgi:hypothetical protein